MLYPAAAFAKVRQSITFGSLKDPSIHTESLHTEAKVRRYTRGQGGLDHRAMTALVSGPGCRQLDLQLEEED